VTDWTSGRGTGARARATGTSAVAIFAALAAALGFLLIQVPNVELLTFTVFSAGVVLGRARGAVTGALAMALYSGANPYGSGAAIPTLFVAQIGAAALAGLAGGAASALWTGDSSRLLWRIVLSALTGLVLTAVYQAAVIVGISAMSPDFRTGTLAVLASNAFFATTHLVSNTILFAILGPAVLPRLKRLVSQSRGSVPLRKKER
jgi:hypothetical protein